MKKGLIALTILAPFLTACPGDRMMEVEEGNPPFTLLHEPSAKVRGYQNSEDEKTGEARLKVFYEFPDRFGNPQIIEEIFYKNPEGTVYFSSSTRPVEQTTPHR
jgi:hypothetical protein